MKVPLLLLAILPFFLLTLPACDNFEALPVSAEQFVGEAQAHEGEVGQTHTDEHQAQHHQEGEHSGGEHHEHLHRVLVSSPAKRDVISTEQWVCQIHSRRHIEICALEGGYLEEIPVNEGQAIKQGELMFKILPTIYEATLDSEKAEAQLAQIELNNTEKLFQQNVVSQQEVALAKAKLAKAVAKVQLAQAELNFTQIKAPFDGIIDRLHKQHGSLIEEGEELTTLSDNSVMWVYFNVPEASYLAYQQGLKHQDEMRIELQLANGKLFSQPGKIGAIEADFNNETGNIAFRADFANPDGLLRHGQTGTILIHRELKNAFVIPQRAAYEILDKRYVYVVDEDNIVHQRPIEVQTELEDIYVIKKGLEAGEKIVLEGIRQVRDGQRTDYEYRDPQEVLDQLKHEAE